MKVLAIWGFLGGLAVGMLLIDILRSMVKPQDMSLREASWWTVAWTSLAALFAVAVFAVLGPERGLEFVTGYAIQWSLSVGNVFVFLMIFQYLALPQPAAQRVLFLGIVGTMVLRCLVLPDAPALLASFSWLIYIFWAFLVWVAIRLLQMGKVRFGVQRRLRFFTHIITVEDSYNGENFFVRRDGHWVATALLPVLVLVLTVDVVFAVNAISASLVVSRDSFIVDSFNILAILGLRALYVLLSGILGMFRYLQAGLCVILLYIAGKMLMAEFVEVPNAVSLGVVGTVLLSSIAATLLFKPGANKADRETGAPHQWTTGQGTDVENRKQRTA